MAQTSVYLRIDNDLVDILSLTDKNGVVQCPLPATGDLLKIQVCSMNKVDQKLYSQLLIPLREVPLRAKNLLTLTLPITLHGDD